MTFTPILFRISFFLLATHMAMSAEWKNIRIPEEKGRSAEAARWLRCHVRVPDNMADSGKRDLWHDSMTLTVRAVNGPFSVKINGRSIGESTGPETRRFKLPADLFAKAKWNTFILEVHGSVGKAPIIAGYFDEAVLTGDWEVSSSAPADGDFAPLDATPAIAAFSEKDFHPASTPLGADAVAMPGMRMTPAEELAQLKPAPDLTVDLVASDPDVAQPTHISFDEHGRMWVSQYRQYPYPAGLKQISRDKFYRAVFDKVPPAPPHQDKGRDIITMHEDTNGDGIYDSSKVVLDGLNMANAALRGHGGLWVMNTPYLLFYPDEHPDTPEVRLAGFGLEDTHSAANGLTWGPDGWLYGAQGSTTTCRVTRPGIDAPPVYFEGCFVWRYHPATRDFEIFAEGGGNTFSLEFDAQGRLFSGHNGGDTRGWHFVQHGIYLMQGKEPGKFGPARNAYAFGEQPMMKSTNPIARFTHSIAMAEGTAMPTSYAGRLLGVDPLHRNVVIADRHRTGSTFETSDTGIALQGDAPIFRPVFITNGPDGAIYIADFCEEYIAHGQHYQGQIDSASGRIFRLRGKASTLEKDINLATKSDEQLVALLAHPNKWHRQTAVRLLAERHAVGQLPRLRALLAEATTHPSLEALWTIYQLGALDEATAKTALAHAAAPVRAWTIRLLGDSRSLSPALAAAIERLASTETDAEVRAQIASTARRIPSVKSIRLIASLLTHDEDAADKYLPHLCWYAIEAQADSDREAVLALATKADTWKSALARESFLPRLVRRFATSGTQPDLLACARVFDAAPSPALAKPLLTAFEEAFQGRALPPLPTPLVDALAKAGDASLLLRVRRGDAAALEEASRLIADAKAKPDDRTLLIRTLGELKHAAALPVLLDLACSDANVEVRRTALGSLQSFDSEEIPARIVKAYGSLPAEVQFAAQALLACRPAWAKYLATLPPESLAPEIAARLTKKPQARPEAQKRIGEIRTILSGAPGDPYAGESTFSARCAVCHTLFHKGGSIGPNLTAYQRDDLGTMLTSIVDPNAEIREGFENFVVTTRDGRTLTGFLAENGTQLVRLRGFDGNDIPLPRDQIVSVTPAGRSLMPEGLLEGLNEKQLRDFFAYLRIPQPISR